MVVSGHGLHARWYEKLAMQLAVQKLQSMRKKPFRALLRKNAKAASLMFLVWPGVTMRDRSSRSSELAITDPRYATERCYGQPPGPYWPGPVANALSTPIPEA